MLSVMACKGGGLKQEVNWLTEEISIEATLQKDMQTNLERDVDLNHVLFCQTIKFYSQIINQKRMPMNFLWLLKEGIELFKVQNWAFTSRFKS